MTFLLLNLLQPQTRLSWVVIAAALIAFAGGVSLLIYFYRRYKRVEREPEEDWDLARRSIFVDARPARPRVEESEAPESVETEASVAPEAPVVVEAPAAEEAPVQTGGTREFASDLNLPSFVSAMTVEPETQIETATPEQPIQEKPAAAPPEPRMTQILASPSLDRPAAEHNAAPQEAAPFDEEIWAGLELVEQPPVTTGYKEPEPRSVARVEQQARHQRLEQPPSGSSSQRKPYEPPSIEPLTPREASATRELRSPRVPAIEQPDGEHREEPVARGTVRLGSASEVIPRPLDSQRPERELAGGLGATAPVAEPEKTIPAGIAPKSRNFGSILGLPSDFSHEPLILGEPARPAGETGIGALTHYGQDLGPKGGRAGTIALTIVVALLSGAAGLYLFVPSVNSQVGAFIARLRGVQTQGTDAMKPKAQIIPSSRPEVNKNLVTARGAVDNISDEPLVKLEVEVSLQRGSDAPPEVRRVPVTPDPLPPGERGTFEFEYDGKRDTGFAGYTITRLFSDGAEVRFRTPAQK
jgi:hypothetical protein